MIQQRRVKVRISNRNTQNFRHWRNDALESRVKLQEYKLGLQSWYTNLRLSDPACKQHSQATVLYQNNNNNFCSSIHHTEDQKLASTES